MPYVYSDIIPTDPAEREWWYNSLDCAVTGEIFDELDQSNSNQSVYDFERSLQAPALDMMLRGFRIDPFWQHSYIDRLQKRQAILTDQINRLAHAVWQRPLNPRSPDQVKDFFYNYLNLPQQWTYKKGERKLSADREALEKLDEYYIASPFVSLIFAARDAGKKLSVLRTGVDPDGRMRCTYNVCGTETGRWASSRNVFGRGSNLQNITEELRRMFVADPGKLIVYIDGEQAESRAVGFIHGRVFDDWTYLDACEEGDLHTSVTKLVWTDLPWTNDKALDRAIADGSFYRWFTYRDMAKRGGHGTNYYGTPRTMARHLKVPAHLIELFQQKYFAAFPMRRWHAWVANELAVRQSLTTFVGRERTFYGRPNDDATLRKAIAYEPQSAVGDLINEGGYRVWKKFPQAEILAQTHDCFVFQIPLDQTAIIPEMISTFQVPVTCRNRTMIIPGEAKTGFNWANSEVDKDPSKRTFRDGNPDGLRKWKGREDRTRVEDPTASLLDRVFY